MLVYVRFHGRGGQGVKTASRILGNAAHFEGYYAQDFPIYGAERRGAPVVAFTRISEEPSPIPERGYIFNPNLVILADESLLNDPLVNPIAGLQYNGVLFVSTRKPAEGIETGRDGVKVVVEDLVDLSLKYLGGAVISTGLGSVAARLTGLIRWVSLEEGVKEELLEIGVKGEMLEKNILLAKACFERVHPSPLPTPKLDEPRKIARVGWMPPPKTIPEIRNIGNTRARKTGNWRVFKPILDLEKCSRCGLCVVYCPEGVIAMRGDWLEIDYDNCKGCLICFNECPVKAFNYIREVEAA